LVVLKDALYAKEGVDLALLDAHRTVWEPHGAFAKMPRLPIRFRQPERMLMTRRDTAVNFATSKAPGTPSGSFEARDGPIPDFSSHSYYLR